MKYSVKEKEGTAYLVAWERNWNNELFSIKLTPEIVKEVLEYNNKTTFFDAFEKKFPDVNFSAIQKSKLYSELCNIREMGCTVEEATNVLLNKNQKCKYYQSGLCYGQKYAPHVNCCGDTWFCDKAGI